jgi:hypothetical protein
MTATYFTETSPHVPTTPDGVSSPTQVSSSGTSPLQSPGSASHVERPFIARGRLLEVKGIFPQAGQPGTSIMVSLVFRPGCLHPNARVRMRIRMAGAPLLTTVKGVPPTATSDGEWQVRVIAPQLDDLGITSTSFEVPIIVEVMSSASREIIENLYIGRFTLDEGESYFILTM